MEREIKTLSRRNLARSEFDGEKTVTYRHAYRVERLEPGNAVVIDVNMRIVGRDIEMLHSNMVTGLQFAIKLNTLGLGPAVAARVAGRPVRGHDHSIDP